MIPGLATVRALGMILLSGFAIARADDPSPYPRPRPSQNPETLGSHIQRTMTLLATSTPEHRNKVRILFYGQSITEQGWWEQVVADLRHRFPNADLEAENRAIGGFHSVLLAKSAEHDVYPFYPDLVIFHVYGDHREYEKIIRNIRTLTAAEILMQTDHLTKWPPESVEKSTDGGAKWDLRMNQEILPGIAKKYGCGLAEIRSGWTNYLKENKIEPAVLLKDEVHLNDHGKFLMASLINECLVYRPDLPAEEWRGLAKTLTIGQSASWKEGRLEIRFEGNRVDALAAGSTGESKPARILIDGKKPSEFAGAYAISRPTPNPWSPLALIRVDHDRPLVEEEWTLTITSFQDNPARWSYRVEGSKTGSDGTGDSASTFRSNSGRVRIESASWFQKKPVEPGYQIHWSVKPLFTDFYSAPKVEDPTREYATTLIQGLPNGNHTLELIADSPAQLPSLRAIRVYNPPVAAQSLTIPVILGGLTILVVALSLTWTARRIRAKHRPIAVTPA